MGECSVFGGRTEKNTYVRGVGKLENEGAVVISEYLVERYGIIKCKAVAVTYCHLEDSLGDAAVGGSVGCKHLALSHKRGNQIVELKKAILNGKTVFVVLRLKEHDLGACLFEFGGDHVSYLIGGYREGDKRGGNVELLEGAAHRVLTADSRNTEVHLSLERTE